MALSAACISFICWASAVGRLANPADAEAPAALAAAAESALDTGVEEAVGVGVPRRNHLTVDLLAVRLEHPNGRETFVAHGTHAALQFGHHPLAVDRILLVLFFRFLTGFRSGYGDFHGVLSGPLQSALLLVMQLVELHDQFEAVAAQQVLEHPRRPARRNFGHETLLIRRFRSGRIVLCRRRGGSGGSGGYGQLIELIGPIIRRSGRTIKLLVLAQLLRRQTQRSATVARMNCRVGRCTGRSAVKLRQGQGQLLAIRTGRRHFLVVQSGIGGRLGGWLSNRIVGFGGSLFGRRFRLFDQRTRQVDLTGGRQFLKFGGARLVQHRAEVDVQRRALTVGHAANVALPRLSSG